MSGSLAAPKGGDREGQDAGHSQLVLDNFCVAQRWSWKLTGAEGGL